MGLSRWIIAACALVIADPVAAADMRTGSVLIDHPVIVKAFAGARAAGGYMTIMNLGDEVDRLVDVTAGEVPTMIHETIEANGVARMVHLSSVDIPVGEAVVFEPGDLHLMFMGLQPGDLPVGATLPVTLRFERAGMVQVAFDVVDLENWER